MKWPTKILMARPNGFRVEYAINPHMKDAEGRLNTVDGKKATAQWESLRQTFLHHDLQVDVIEGDPRFPDMVFCANQTFFYPDRGGSTHVVLGRMGSEQRRGETALFREWARKNDIAIEELADITFEGCGDAIWNYETGEIFGGFGFRTEEAAYEHIGRMTGATIHKLRLISENFYHLDTCLAILNGKTAAYAPEAFTAEGRALLKAKFPDLIVLDRDEAIKNFAGNALCVDGRLVILQSGSKKFVADLKARGFLPVEVDTTEFIKAGGSVFCMKQLICT